MDFVKPTRLTGVDSSLQEVRDEKETILEYKPVKGWLCQGSVEFQQYTINMLTKSLRYLFMVTAGSGAHKHSCWKGCLPPDRWMG